MIFGIVLMVLTLIAIALAIIVSFPGSRGAVVTAISLAVVIAAGSTAAVLLEGNSTTNDTVAAQQGMDGGATQVDPGGMPFGAAGDMPDMALGFSGVTGEIPAEQPDSAQPAPE